MGLYRASPDDGIAWVTGASSGIGRQIALNLATAGYTVAATARSEQKLTALSASAEQLAGRIIPFPCDLTDEAATGRTIAAIENTFGPIALAVLNAGNYFPTSIDRLDTKSFLNTYEINVFGVIYCLVPLINRMREHSRGHIVLTGSVSSYFGLPTTAAYGATKAALNNMVWSLKHDLDKVNIRIQIVNPGFVDTPLTAKNSFPMPALMQVDKAAERVIHAISSGGVEVTFPRRFTWVLKALGLLPLPVSHWVINRATGWNKRPVRKISVAGAKPRRS